MLPNDIRTILSAVVPKGVSHIGIVIKDVAGRYLVLLPEKASFGVTSTLPRMKGQAEEEPFDTLIRCLKEKVGIRPVSAYPILNVWTTENSSTFYFVGMVTEEICTRTTIFQWCRLDEAEALLRSSNNLTTRNRDIAVLKSAADINPSPYRRILLMIRELHGMGFGRLRAVPWSHRTGYPPPPSGWSCAVVPATVIDANNGAMNDVEWIGRLRISLGMHQHQLHDPFETISNQTPFNWTDAAFDTPKQLAIKFKERFREICYMGWGNDPAYEAWYDEMLEKTTPHGVFVSVLQDNEFVRSAFTAEEFRIVVPPKVGR